MARKPAPPSDAPTLKEIARRLGVHVSTVSRALNVRTRGLVKDEVAQRIVATAAELNYRPNYLASSLRTRRSMTIGLVLPDIQNATFPIMAQAIEATLSAENYLTLVAHAVTGYPDNDPIVEQMMNRRVDGLILATARRHTPLIELCEEKGVPLVTISRAEDDVVASSIVNDDLSSMRLAVDHLVAIGHRRIAHLAGPTDTSTGQQRWAGFQLAMHLHGLAPAAVVDTLVYTREEGARATAQLLTEAPDLTAIVVANDMLAIGCIDLLKTRGVNCPRDISVIGHNDMPLVDMIGPPLTTVRIDYPRMGTEAALLMLRRIEMPEAPSVNIALKPTLIERKSVAPPRRP